MRLDEDPLRWSTRLYHDGLGQSRRGKRRRRRVTGVAEHGAKRLLILFEAGRIDVGQIIGKYLKLTFLRDGSGKDRIDGTIHSVSFLANRGRVPSSSNRYATVGESFIAQRDPCGTLSATRE